MADARAARQHALEALEAARVAAASGETERLTTASECQALRAHSEAAARAWEQNQAALEAEVKRLSDANAKLREPNPADQACCA